MIFIPPPLYYVAGLVAGAALDRLAGLSIGGRPVTVVAGAALAGVGLLLTGGGVFGVIGHRTTIVPHHRVASLVTTGAYRLSRNPMYTGLAVIYLGVALVIGSWWPVVLWPAVLLAVHRLVIRPEERYLEQRFGPAYAEYRARVRRWL
ncbi:methyltransferase family protein [Dactylosporangium cerinum]